MTSVRVETHTNIHKCSIYVLFFGIYYFFSNSFKKKEKCFLLGRGKEQKCEKKEIARTSRPIPAQHQLLSPYIVSFLHARKKTSF